MGLGIYLLSTGASFAAFSTMKEKVVVSPLAEEEIGDGSMSFTGPATEECPINGAMYPKDQRSAWEKLRPLLVVIENHEDSRPQSGLMRADAVYEAVAEGGITRFLGVYYCKAVEGAPREYDLGPVRSARTYFLDWASEYSDYPLYVHVGGAHCSRANPSDPRSPCTSDRRVQALEQIGDYGWLDSNHHSDMNQFALSYKECRREPERTGRTVATEHTMYCDTQALWDEARERGLEAKGSYGGKWDEDFQSWEFKDDADEKGSVNAIEFDFWKGYAAYKAKWDYDSENNRYLRTNGGTAQNDLLTNEPVAAKVVVVQFSKETGPVDDHKHLVYGTTGKGDALIFQDGDVVKGKWSKTDRLSRTIFTDSKGEEIEFNRGLIWIEVLPVGNEVDYEAS